jgi:hypothetical protein
MHPRQMRETLSPVLPSLMYSIFVVVAVPVSARKHTDRLITVDPGDTLFGADAPAINDNYQRNE